MHGCRVKNTVGVVCALMVILGLPISLYAKYSGGSGEPNDPYLLSTPYDINDIGNHPEDYNKAFLLVSDINMAGFDSNSYKIIGPEYDTPFTGIFDGNNHTIYNFRWYSDHKDFIGLFGSATSGAIIKNLNLINIDINAVTIDANNELWAGGLIGYAREETTIENCYVSGRIAGCLAVGLLAGWSDGNVINCHADGNAVGSDSVGILLGGTSGNISNSYSAGLAKSSTLAGGLVGNALYYDTIQNCFSKADVNDGNSAGGLIGSNSGGRIVNCYAQGNVTGDANVGGLIGNNFQGLVEKSYSTGLVTGILNTGGLIGYSELSEVDSCVWDVNTSSQQTSSGGTGLTTSQMQTQTAYADLGWDFIYETVNGPNDIWAICENTNYPKFSWQKKLGDIVCPDGVNMLDYSSFSMFWLISDCYNFYEIDIFPDADNIINEFDFAVLAKYWLQLCESCDNSDYNHDGTVNEFDLKILAQYWLNASDRGCKKADLTGDRSIDIDDFAIIAENWLTGE